jgi:peptidyl-prolyl cis-trans isomerase C
MYSHSSKNLSRLPVILILGLSACTTLFGTPATATPEIPTGTPVPPTPTPPPLAATVNGEWITKRDFQAEVDRYLSAQESLGLEVGEDEAAAIVLEDMIDQLLLAQAARAEGFQISESDLQSRIDALAAQMGGMDALANWESQHGYTDESFRFTLQISVEAAWMRDKIIADVPATMEQVHARQILLYNEETARNVAGQLDAGVSFSELAVLYDPNTGGELGWFPRGYLFEQGLEDTAFSLEPGQYSEVISTEVGYHIIQVLERDAEHQLSPDAYLVLQTKALQDWLQGQRSAATIERTP